MISSLFVFPERERHITFKRLDLMEKRMISYKALSEGFASKMTCDVFIGQGGGQKYDSKIRAP
jgi:hypothetical protein